MAPVGFEPTLLQNAKTLLESAELTDYSTGQFSYTLREGCYTRVELVNVVTTTNNTYIIITYLYSLQDFQ